MGGHSAHWRCLPACFALALLLIPAGAFAASPLKVREVFPGSDALGPKAEFVELQMTGDGQGDIDGQVMRFYAATGSESFAFTVPADVANGQSQYRVLFTTPEAEAFGMVGDFSLPSADQMNPAGGAVCLTGAAPPDCVAWGSFASPVALPDSQAQASVSITNGLSLNRSIAKGCATYLDAPDDTNDSSADFVVDNITPEGNSATPAESRCRPNTVLASFPSNPSNLASPSFDFDAVPSEPGISFECELDGNGSFSTAVACDSGSISYPGPLSDGLHTFRVRAGGEGGLDLTPASYTWTIDTVVPDTAIDSTPPEPSSGFSASFTYHSSEPQSGFRCQLDSSAIQVCSSSGKTYFGLADGTHVFRVWAVDNADNKDGTPAEHSFTVQTVLGDVTPPDTLIASSPANPSSSPDASFTYSSSEQGSTFQCRLDSAPFAPCSLTGAAYGGLRNGVHSFEARAIDPAGNIDSVPAAFRWRVAAPLPDTRITKGPPGRVQLRSGKRAKLRFAFSSDKPGSSFRCRLDKASFKPCGRTKTIKAGPGRHRFEVHAIDSLGNVETTPARRIVRVVRQGGGGFF